MLCYVVERVAIPTLRIALGFEILPTARQTVVDDHFLIILFVSDMQGNLIAVIISMESPWVFLSQYPHLYSESLI